MSAASFTDAFTMSNKDGWMVSISRHCEHTDSGCMNNE